MHIITECAKQFHFVRTRRTHARNSYIYIQFIHVDFVGWATLLDDGTKQIETFDTSAGKERMEMPRCAPFYLFRIESST